MHTNVLKAKVFISCGQRKGTEELEIAHKIANILIKAGFDPYIAVEEQTLKGLKENIFKQLETSEYIVFIDFLREEIRSGKQETFRRGSLFSHQELAIASYLNKQLMSFQEEGIKYDDGLMRFLQGNSITFNNRDELPAMVDDRLKKLDWNPEWKNQLSLKTSPSNFADATIGPENQMCRFFHIDVDNLNPIKAALNCYGYIEKIINLDDKAEIKFEMSELKWKGYTFPNVIIGPKRTRKLDAFWVYHQEPNILRFNIFSDYGGNLHGLAGGSKLEFTYSIISENFPIEKKAFIVENGKILDEVKIYQAS